MTEEPTTEEIPDVGDERPATNRDVASLQSELRDLRKDVAGKPSKKEAIDQISNVKEEMRVMKEEILHHFDAAVENIEEELKGANADEISLLHDVDENHETRITAIERQAGMR